MEVLAIHKANGVLPPEAMAASIEMGKKLYSNPGQFVPGGKLIASYAAIGITMVVCLWDVPKMEALMPVMEKMNIGGWNTDIIPVEKTEVRLSSLEKAFQEMLAKR